MRVVVAGAGLAGLTAARYLERAGAEVTVVEARDRVGGRVHTVRGFENESACRSRRGPDRGRTDDLLSLAATSWASRPFGFSPSGWGFYGSSENGRRKVRDEADTFERVAERLDPGDSRLQGRRLALGLGGQPLAGAAVGRRLDERARPGARARRRPARPARLLPRRSRAALAAAARRSVRVRRDSRRRPRCSGCATATTRCRPRSRRPSRPRLPQHGADRDRAPGIEAARQRSTTGQQQQLTADYVVMALPASTLRSVRFVPALPAAQWQAISTLRYGRATRVLLQFESAVLEARRPAHGLRHRSADRRRLGRQRAAGRPSRASSACSPAARASAKCGQIIETQGWPGAGAAAGVARPPVALLHGLTVAWDRDQWSKAATRCSIRASTRPLRPWLARPAGRDRLCRRAHQRKWQGYMNGAVESGKRAALEVAVMAGSGLRARLH